MHRWSHQKYTYKPAFGWNRHSWEIHCSEGAIELNVSVHKDGEYDPSCGLEYHSRKPDQNHMRSTAPSHIECHLLKAPCWHDGTSSYASDLWNQHGLKQAFESGNHDSIFRQLEMDGNRYWFNKEEAEYEVCP